MSQLIIFLILFDWKFQTDQSLSNNLNLPEKTVIIAKFPGKVSLFTLTPTFIVLLCEVNIYVSCSLLSFR